MENISNLILVFKFVICYSLLRGKMKGVLFQTILSDRLTALDSKKLSYNS